MVDIEYEELDRWREAGKRVGRSLGIVAERKRIIKFLKDLEADKSGVTLHGAIALLEAPRVIETKYEPSNGMCVG